MNELIFTLDELGQAGPLFDKSAVAVGNFDGVHLGHRRVLEHAVRRADQLDAAAVAMTFDPHPRAVVGDGAPPILAAPELRRKLMQSFGLHAMVTLRFDRHVAALPPEAFVEDVLAGALAAAHVVVGDDFRFGYRARGTAELLARLGRQHDYTVETVSAVRAGDVVISSSAIRRALQQGDVTTAAALLGRDYEVSGVVVKGEGRGASLGFATANVEPRPGLLVPGEGVYIARALDRPAVAVVGNKPTFGGEKIALEVHILDFDEDLLGSRLDVQFAARLRDVRRFESVEALTRQMARDVTETRKWFRWGSEVDVVR